MIGLLLIVIGILAIWVVFKGKAGPVLNAVTGDTGFDASLSGALSSLNLGNTGTSSSGSSSNGSPGSANAADSGVHMGIDSSGNIVTINKPYSSMSPGEQDAANQYARQIGNVNG